MNAIAIIERATTEGLSLSIQGDKLAVVMPKGRTIPESLAAEFKTHKPAIIKALETEAIRQAFIRLELGETQAVRLFSRTCGGEFIVTAEGDIPESITVDCPHFTITELKKLIAGNVRGDLLHKVFMVKQAFPGSKVEEITQCK